MFRGHAKNINSELEFSDHSVKTQYNSSDAEYIKQQIRKKLEGVSVLICLIGRTTHKSEWVDWEIIAASTKGKGLVGVRLHSDYKDTIPNTILRDEGIITNWNHQEIINAIEKAAKKAGY
jgi:hypothetical protein